MAEKLLSTPQEDAGGYKRSIHDVCCGRFFVLLASSKAPKSYVVDNKKQILGDVTAGTVMAVGSSNIADTSYLAFIV